MATTYSNVQVSKVLTLRGNTIQNNRYTGIAGEITVDTQVNSIRIHDGSTLGGHPITSAIDTSQPVTGNLIPSANVAYSLGSQTYQWKDLWVSSNTIYIGGTPLSINSSGNLLVNGNVVSGSGGGNSLINGNNIVSLDSNGGLNLANVGLIRAPNNGAGAINLASDYFVQMQWSANSNTVDPNADWTGSTTWVYVDNGGFHVEAITPGHDAYWNFDTAGNFTFPDNTIQTTAFSNVALSNYLAGTVTIGNLTVQGNITTVNTEIVQHNEIVAGNITSNSYVTAQYFQGGAASLSTVNTTGNVTIGGNLTVYGNILTFGNVTQVLTTVYGNTGQFFGGSNGFGALYAGIASGYSVQSQTVLELASNYNGYSQLNLQNINSGNSASGDIVVTMDNGNATVGYIDIGINSSGFTGGSGNELNYPGDGYLYVYGNPLTGGGNLLLSTALNNDIVFSTGGQGSANELGRFVNSTKTFKVTGNITATGQMTIGSTNVIANLGATAGTLTTINANLGATSGTLATITANLGSVAGSLATLTANVAVQAGNLATITANLGAVSGSLANLTANTGGLAGAIVTANTAMKGYVDSVSNNTSYGNSNVAAYLVANPQGSTYSNSNVASYLPTYSGNIGAHTVTGNVTANYFIGNGALLTGIVASAGTTYSNSNVASYLPTYSGNVNAGNVNATYIYASGYVSTGAVYSPTIGNTGATLTGTLSTAAQPSITQVGVLTNLTVTGNITANAGAYFIGNGALLTGIVASGTTYSNSNVASYLPTYSGNIANVRLGNSGVLTFADGTTMTTAASGVGSTYSNTNVTAYLTSVSIGPYANANVIAYLTTNNIGPYSNANVISYITANNIGPYANANVASYLPTYTGNVGAGNIVGTSANTTITANNYTTTFDITGNVTFPGNIITTQYLYGNGAFLTGIVSSSGSSNYSNSNVAAYLPTYTGNVGAANVNANYVYATNYVSTGAVYSPQIGNTGATLTGTLSTAAQTNITQVGTLTNLTVTGNITANTGAYFIGNGAFLTGIVASGTTYSNSNVASYLPTYSGNIANVRLGTNGKLTFADGTTMTTAATGGSSSYGNSNVAAYLPTYFGNVGNVTFGASSISFPLGTQFFEINNLDSEIQVPYQFTINTSGGSVQYTFGNSGYLGLPGGLVFPDSSQQTTGYSNAAVQTYLSSVNPVKIGASAGSSSQGTDAVAIGRSAGAQQGIEAVAIGVIAGQTNQNNWAVAIGSSAGTSGQGQRAVAIGVQSAETNQGTGAVAIGAYAGDNTQGQYAVAIGTHAGDSNQPASSIILNASGSPLNGSNSGLYINPVRNDLANVANVVYYNAVTNELTYAPAPSGGSGTNYSNANVASYLPTYSGNIANITLGTSGVLTFADGTTQTTASGSSYSNVNVTAFLANSSILNFGNIGNTYPTQSNISQVFVGQQTALTSAGGTNTTTTYLMNNLYFGANGAAFYRNTQSGAAWITIAGSGINFAGTSGAVTANTVQGMGSWAQLNSTAFATQNAVGITSAGTLAVNGTGGITTTQGTFPLLNATATTINFGGAATTITMGTTASNVWVGSALGNNTKALTLRATGVWNTTVYGSSSGGYNSPPYNNVATTGGSGAGMTVNLTGVNGGYPSGATVVNPGVGYKNGDVITATGGAYFTITNYSSINTGNSAAAYTLDIDGNLTVPGNLITTGGLFISNISSANYITANTIVTTGGWGNISNVAYITANTIISTASIVGDFSNANVNARTTFVTSATNGTTGIYAVPNGSSTGAAWQAANSSNLAAASKIMITTNGTTDVQLVSGVNGAGTYLPLSFYNNGAAQMQLTVSGNLNMTVNNSIATSGTGYFIGNVVGTQYGNSSGTTATYTGNITAGGSSGPQTRFLWDTWQANSTSALSAFTPSGTIGGNATWDSTQAYGLKLTTTTTSQSGYISWNSSTVNYTYDMTITASIGASGGTGADGQWIYFGANAVVSGNPGNTNSFGGIVVFNHFYSGANQFEVYVNGTQTNIPFILEGSSSYNPSGITVWNASYTSFYNLTLKIRKIQNGNRMMEVYLNEAYQGAVNISSWTPAGNYYGVAAYTGGSTAQMWVRQLRIDW